MYMKTQTAVIDNFTIQIEDEKNLLELIRKANIELPTFCYHSEISVYGACRMCMVEIEGRGIVPACSTKPEGGMVVHTNTAQIRKMRKMIIELMLASHDQSCTTCPKSGDCKLQNIAKQLGVDKIRFKQMKTHQELDLSSDAIIRDPGKCILCGDCVSDTYFPIGAYSAKTPLTGFIFCGGVIQSKYARYAILAFRLLF